MRQGRASSPGEKDQYRPDWQNVCHNCGSTPVVPVSGLCGPCHFGEADMVSGGWWDEQADDFDLGHLEVAQ
jgi:hypothetical protein